MEIAGVEQAVQQTRENLNTLTGSLALNTLVSGLVTFLVCVIAIRILKAVLTRTLNRMTRLDPPIRNLIIKLVTTLLWVLTIIIVAGAFGINATSLVALLSVVDQSHVVIDGHVLPGQHAQAFAVIRVHSFYLHRRHIHLGTPAKHCGTKQHCRKYATNRQIHRSQYRLILRSGAVFRHVSDKRHFLRTKRHKRHYFSTTRPESSRKSSFA